MTTYTIGLRDGPLHNSIIKIDTNITPGETFNLPHLGKEYTYRLLVTAVAKMTYREGSTPASLACGAIYVDPLRN